MKQLIELNDEQIKAAAPSVFSESAISGVSESYKFLPTSRVVEALRQENWAPVSAQECRTRSEDRKGFQKHLLRFQRREDLSPVSFDVGNVRPEIVLANSHDGSSSYQIHLGLFRLVCSNGLVVADAVFGSIKVRHVGREIQEVIEASSKIYAEAPLAIDAVRRYQSVQLDDSRQLDLAKRALSISFDDNVRVQAEQLLTPRRREDQQNDLWTVFNRIQENVLRGGLQYARIDAENRQHRASTRSVRSIDRSLKLNKDLWSLLPEFSQN